MAPNTDLSGRHRGHADSLRETLKRRLKGNGLKYMVYELKNRLTEIEDMRKIIAGMNMTLDGFCDHTAMIADDEIHEHYNDLLSHAGSLLYGRVTYQLMESYWPTIVKNPTGNKPTDKFAVLIDGLPKVVFSRTLKSVDWKNSTLKNEIAREDILAMKQQTGKDILVGSPSLIVALGNLNLIDEYQIGVQPIVLGSGLTLFKNVKERIDLKLIKTKTFKCGAVMFYHEPVKK